MEAHPASSSTSPASALFFAASVALALFLRRRLRQTAVPSVESRPSLPKAPPPVALVRGQRCGFPLIARRSLSHDTVLLRFGLPSPRHVLGLPAGQHLFCYAAIEGETVVRAYSTITPPETRGYFDISLKVYFPSAPKYPNGGKMSQFLNDLSVGDVVVFKGPVGRFVYDGLGVFSKNRKTRQARKISMIAGGTGVNPFMQIILKVLQNPTDTTEISLIYANKSEKDILFRHELDHLAARHWNFSIFHTVEKASWCWLHGRGRIHQKMLERHLFKADEESILLLCGPGPMTDAISEICTNDLGWSRDQISVF